MAATTRGPLPPGVYWRRRLAVLSVALVVFLGVGKVLDLGSDGSSGDAGRAEQVGAQTTSTPAAPVESTADPAETTDPAGTQGTKNKNKNKGKGKNKNKGKNKGKNAESDPAAPDSAPEETPAAVPPPPLPEPTGPCAEGDVFITPTIDSAIGGSDVTIVLNLQTRVTEACTWQVSPRTVTMKITSGRDKIWASNQCPSVIPVQDVVVRLASITQVPVVWNARRSDEECSDRTAWALPGFYHVTAAALGGEQTDVQFELLAPAPPTVTQSVRPRGSGRAG